MELLYWGLGLIGIGIILMILELFLPTGGSLAIAAVASMIAGVVCLFRYETIWGMSSLLGVIILLPVAVSFGVKHWPHTPMGRRIIGAATDEEVAEKRLAEEEARKTQLAVVGMEGVVVVDLRPIGVVEVGGKRYDARSESRFSPVGTKIKVVAVEANELRVRALA
jgi:membrane-bound ClpP family serine protease